MKGLPQKLGPNRDLVQLEFSLYLNLLSYTPLSAQYLSSLRHLSLSLVEHLSAQKGLDWPYLGHVLILALITVSKGMEYYDQPRPKSLVCNLRKWVGEKHLGNSQQ